MSTDRSRRALIASMLLAVAGPRSVLAQNGALGVVYPDVQEPYLAVFLQMIEGIKERARGEVALNRIRSNTEASVVNGWLREHGIRRAIMLGRQGVRLSERIDREVRVVVGGAILAIGASAATVPGISLTPDPEQLFAVLKRLAPSTRRVTVVYSPAQNQGVVNAAADAARRNGFDLVAREAQDLRAAAGAYQDTIAAAQGRRDALWLPHDTMTVDDDVILPMILQEAWTKEIVVLSSSFAHAKKGALFALYPDNRGYGRDLANLAYASGTPVVVPLRAVRTAVNLRTASHLGLDANPASFDAAFPEP